MGETVSFPSNGQQTPGHLALPSGPGSGPGVIVIQEWWGLVPHVIDVAERLAAEGFVALAPDLYHGAATTEPDEAAKLLMALDLERAGKDIVGAAAYLRGRDEVTGTGVGVIGFCMGGALALWSGTLSSDVTATVPFYPYMAWELTPNWPAYAGKAVVMHLAEGDGGSVSPPVQAATAALETAGATVTLHDYPGTQHAFVNDTRPEVYDADAAELAWSRTIEFLRERLG